MQPTPPVTPALTTPEAATSDGKKRITQEEHNFIIEFRKMYPHRDRQTIADTLGVDQSILPRPEMANKSNVEVGHVLLEESIRVRQGSEYPENSSHLTVLTSWFYSGCCFGLAEEEIAWTYLREATTQAHLLGMHKEETYTHESLDSSHRRKLYWVLFIAERTYALRNKRPTSLSATIYPPSFHDVASDRYIVVGLEFMINMFKIIGDEIINAWHKSQGDCTNVSWIDGQLKIDVSKTMSCTYGQSFQIHITKLWLHLKFWEMRQREGFLDKPETVTEGISSLPDPIRIAWMFLSIWRLFGQKDKIILGQGLISFVQALPSLAVKASILPAPNEAIAVFGIRATASQTGLPLIPSPRSALSPGPNFR
ncbi:transcription factor Pf2 [Stemphylium lycopersici]|uniref:Transcription factor Pf2 n=1 Tax=Stemphylium lycopersici TaxID=183478 RepID=A0A364MTD0_STELY|nr:hypothetical protein TW65_09332 [Stemphylium lycopersici]RAQ98757.1 transcription factor Pf2 [Stemphylium lycopersici]RAR01999.1 transcription factor Pf2 [Stemphylium lycopersici]